MNNIIFINLAQKIFAPLLQNINKENLYKINLTNINKELSFVENSS